MAAVCVWLWCLNAHSLICRSPIGSGKTDPMEKPFHWVSLLSTARWHPKAVTLFGGRGRGEVVCLCLPLLQAQSTKFCAAWYHAACNAGVLKFKHESELALMASGLPYTLLRPSRLTDGPYTSYDLNTLLQVRVGASSMCAALA